MSQITAYVDGLNPYLALAIGLVFMAFAGHFLVVGAVSIARKLGVSPLIAGIFIVGFGTSAPEMVVSLDAAMKGNAGLALGNIVGSNIANVWLVLAIPALIKPFMAGGAGQKNALLAMLIVTAVWIILTATLPLHAGIGMAFILGLIGYSTYTFYSARKMAQEQAGAPIPVPGDAEKRIALPLALTYVPIGIIGLVLGANLIVSGGTRLAESFGVSQEIIGLTLLAVGTSLPEIGAGIAAVLNRKGEVLFGNILGSNIFNLLGAGGIISFFGPVKVADTFQNYDHWAMAAAALTAGIFIVTKSKVSRLAAILMLLIYALYLYGLVNGFSLLGLFQDGAV